MDGTRAFLEFVLAHRLAEGRLRGVFHIAIGRRVASADGSAVSAGVTWRELASLLKDLKFDKEWVRALGADPDTLAPRDKEKFWYHAVAAAKVDSLEARAEADQLAVLLQTHGWTVGPPPPPPAAAKLPAKKAAEDTETTPPGPKKKPKSKKK